MLAYDNSTAHCRMGKQLKDYAPISAVAMQGESEGCPPASAKTLPQGSTMSECPYEARFSLCCPTCNCPVLYTRYYMYEKIRKKNVSCEIEYFVYCTITGTDRWMDARHTPGAWYCAEQYFVYHTKINVVLYLV